VAAARWLGASAVTVVARHPHQIAAAQLLGADEVLHSDDDHLASSLRKRRAPLVVEAVGGSADTLSLAAAVVGWRGEVVCLGAFDGPQTLDVGSMMNREIRAYFAVAYAAREGTHDLAVALDLMANGDVELGALVTHRYPLADIGEAFATAADKRSGAIRVVVQP
jgi:threonine dehydrogenase-like Zn-dependent dehydrogenase